MDSEKKQTVTEGTMALAAIDNILRLVDHKVDIALKGMQESAAAKLDPRAATWITTCQGAVRVALASVMHDMVSRYMEQRKQKMGAKNEGTSTAN